MPSRDEEEPRPRRRDEDLDFEEDDRPRSRRKKKKAGGGLPGWALGLIIGGSAFLVLLIVGVIILIVVLNNRSPRQQLVGRWEPTAGNARFGPRGGPQSMILEFTSGNEVKISVTAGQPGMQNLNANLSGTYRWVDDRTIEMNIAFVPTTLFSVSISGDTLTMTPKNGVGGPESFRRVR